MAGRATHGSADLVVSLLRLFDVEDEPVERRVRVRLDIARIAAAEHAVVQAYVALDQAYALAFDQPELEASVRREEVRIAVASGDIRRGVGAAERALEGKGELGARLLADIAELFAAAKDARANATIAAAEATLDDDDPTRRAFVETRRANVLLLAGDATRGARAARVATDLARAMDLTALFAEGKLALGDAYMATGSRERAAATFLAVLESAGAGGQPRLERAARLRIAYLTAIHHPSDRGAYERLRALTADVAAIGNPVDAALAEILVGECARVRADTDVARRAFATATSLAERAGHRALAERAIDGAATIDPPETG